VKDLEAAIREYIDVHNEDPKPFVWTKTADQILASIARYAQRTNAAQGLITYDTNLWDRRLEVLIVFAQSGDFLGPDGVRERLPNPPERRSLYSYLKRLRQQGLLERNPRSRRGQLAYRITQKGRARLVWLRDHSG
jgi:hypothetical protein